MTTGVDVWCVAKQVDSRCQPPPAVDSLTSSSSSLRHQTVVTSRSGFLSSPNYPHVYATIADCWWTLTTQPTQSIRLTVYDFQLSVKTGNVCRDYLRITASTLTPAGSEFTVFEDCGSLGLQVFDIAASRVQLHFHAGQSSQPHRGFLIHYTGSVRVLPSFVSRHVVLVKTLDSLSADWLHSY